MREVLVPSCLLRSHRPKYPDSGLELPVYIGPDFYWTPGLFGTANYHGLPTNPEGGYTAVRMGDMGSMASGSDWVILSGTTGLPGTAVR